MRAAGILQGGGGGGSTTPADVVRYVAAVVKRKRERLARALSGHVPAGVVDRIVSEDQDAEVFRWAAPGMDPDGRR